MSCVTTITLLRDEYKFTDAIFLPQIIHQLSYSRTQWKSYSGLAWSRRKAQDQAERCTATTDVLRLWPTTCLQASTSWH